MSKDWKDLLLRSGLPLEYEVRECFVEKGCTVWEETSYLRCDAQSETKEFAYDVHANCWIGGYSVDFIVECKYKIGDTKWFFTPYPYHYQYDLDKNDFLHPIDHFVDHSCHFNLRPYSTAFDALGPFCQKGVELFEREYLEKNIRKAISQVSYAFIDRVTDCWNHQLTVPLFEKAVFCNVPIIITNADLYQINPKTTVAHIRKAKAIEEVSTRTDFLLYHNPIGSHLREYNMMKLADFFSSVGEELVHEKLNSFTKDIHHLSTVFCADYCPRLILIMQHTDDHRNYDKLFSYIHEVLEPGEQTMQKIREFQEEFERTLERYPDHSQKKDRGQARSE